MPAAALVCAAAGPGLNDDDATMKLMRTCQDVTRLVLESQDRRLRPLEGLSLRMHWLACSGCRNFRDQSRLMRQALDRWRTYRDEP